MQVGYHIRNSPFMGKSPLDIHDRKLMAFFRVQVVLELASLSKVIVEKKAFNQMSNSHQKPHSSEFSLIFPFDKIEIRKLFPDPNEEASGTSASASADENILLMRTGFGGPP